MELAATRLAWTALLRDHARLHAPAAPGLGLAPLVVLTLLVQSVAQLASGNAAPGLRLALLGGAAWFAATSLGLMLGFAVMMVLDTTLG